MTLALVVVGCGHPTDPKHAGSTATGPVHATHPTTLAPGGQAGKAAATTPAIAAVVPVVGCPTPSCAFHAGAGAYFTCLAGGAGACFHFGAACAPADGCMYDPAARAYKQCARAIEGTCAAWGAACAPGARCMFNPADGLHHHCDDVSGGSCRRYGALCAP